jgi:hypothetical protein
MEESSRGDEAARAGAEIGTSQREVRGILLNRREGKNMDRANAQKLIAVATMAAGVIASYLMYRRGESLFGIARKTILNPVGIVCFGGGRRYYEGLVGQSESECQKTCYG